MRKSRCYSWVNQLFLWPFSIISYVYLPEGNIKMMGIEVADGQNLNNMRTHDFFAGYLDYPGHLRTVSPFVSIHETTNPSWRPSMARYLQHDMSCCHLICGLEHFVFSYILGIIIPTDFHIFQRCWNHQPVIFVWETGDVRGTWCPNVPMSGPYWRPQVTGATTWQTMWASLVSQWRLSLY